MPCTLSQGGIWNGFNSFVFQKIGGRALERFDLWALRIDSEAVIVLIGTLDESKKSWDTVTERITGEYKGKHEKLSAGSDNGSFAAAIAQKHGHVEKFTFFNKKRHGAYRC